MTGDTDGIKPDIVFIFAPVVIYIRTAPSVYGNRLRLSGGVKCELACKLVTFPEYKSLFRRVKAMSKSKMYTIEKIKPVIEEIVEQKLIELLGDPDSGLELRPQVRKR